MKMYRVVVFLAMSLAISNAQGQVSFSDNFDDGEFDGWTVRANVGNGTFDASSGELSIRSDGGPPPGVGVQTIFSDAAVAETGQFSFRITPESIETQSGVLFRFDADTGDGYATGLIRDPFGNSAIVNRLDGMTPSVPFLVLENVWTPGKSYDFNLEVVGSEFSLEVTDIATGETWSGMGTDSTYANSDLGFWVANSPFTDVGAVGAAFDNVRFEVIPEPSAAMMLLWISIGVLVLMQERISGPRRPRHP